MIFNSRFLRQVSGSCFHAGAARLAFMVMSSISANTLAASPAAQLPGLTTRDVSGWLRTFTQEGVIDRSNPFFQPLGSNGRTCESCHRQAEGWTVTPDGVQKRFRDSAGTDPIFRTVDGSNSPLADVSTLEAKRAAYSMLLSRGVIRVGLPIPDNAEFTLETVDDPYGFASAAELSLFRRPLPSTNLSFLTGVMWDGRETVAPFLPPMDPGMDNADLTASFRNQAGNAVTGHAEGAAPPDDGQLQAIVRFEMGLTTAQVEDDLAGKLNEDDALGGPRVLANQRFFVGLNDTLGADPTGAAFGASAMSLFGGWERGGSDAARRADRKSVQRGEQLFNSKPISITGVGGLNDALGQETIAGTCTTCHDAPNVGNHTVTLPLNIGLTDASQRTPDMPLYTLRNKITGDLVSTTDPGKALLSGKWSDIGKFKGPVLRGLAARAPYFHNGMAASIEDAVTFYNTRFAIGFTAQEKTDLAAFLRSL